jgi:hypothetical protein
MSPFCGLGSGRRALVTVAGKVREQRFRHPGPTSVVNADEQHEGRLSQGV